MPDLYILKLGIYPIQLSGRILSLSTNEFALYLYLRLTEILLPIHLILDMKKNLLANILPNFIGCRLLKLSEV